MIYLASPYTHPDPLIRELRYLQALKVCAARLKAGQMIYSPIVHCHDMAKVFGLPKDISFWRPYNFHMIDLSEEFKILRLDGWEASQGIAEEKTYAEEQDIPVTYL